MKLFALGLSEFAKDKFNVFEIFVAVTSMVTSKLVYIYSVGLN